MIGKEQRNKYMKLLNRSMDNLFYEKLARNILFGVIVAILLLFGAIYGLNFKLALIVIFGVLVFFCFWFDLRMALVVTLLSVLFGQVVRLDLGTGAILVSDMMMAILFTVWLIYFLSAKKKVGWNLVFFALLAFLLISFLLNWRAMGVFTVGDTTTMWLYWLRMFLYSMFLPISWSVIAWDKDSKKYFRWIILLAIGFLFLGFVQLVFIPDISFLAHYGWDPHVGRLLSTFLDPNFAGALLVFFFAITLSYYFSYSNWSGPKHLWAIFTSMLMVGVVLTYSRSAYVALAVVFLILSFWKDKRILALGMIVGLMMFLGDARLMERVDGIFEVDVTAQKRIQSWENNLMIVEDNIWYGIGYNNLLDENMRRGYVRDAKLHSAAGSDSSYLTIWSTLGIFGLISYIVFWVITIGVLMMIYFDERKELMHRWLSLGVAMGVIGVLVHAQFTNSLLYNHIYMVILFSVALCMGWQGEKSYK